MGWVCTHVSKKEFSKRNHDLVVSNPVGNSLDEFLVGSEDEISFPNTAD
jgi:hypothetical protein